MITVTTNIGKVFGELKIKLESLKSGDIRDKLFRTIATTMAAEIRYRVHVDGKKTDGGDIGTYKNPYLAKRQESPYNRTADTKMIFSLTRQMENDFFLVDNKEPIKTADGYALGFKNKFNLEKANWLQYGTKAGQVKEYTRKGKNKKGEPIKVASHQRKGHAGFGVVYEISEKERELAHKITDEFLDKLWNAPS